MKKFILLLIIIGGIFGITKLLESNEVVATQQVEKNEQSSANSPIKKLPEKIEKKNGKQIINGTITYEEGLIPFTYTVKVGIPVRLEIDPKDDIDGCMSTILIPELFEEIAYVKAGKKIVMEFTPKNVGEYYITCAMGIEWGVIDVVQ